VGHPPWSLGRIPGGLLVSSPTRRPDAPRTPCDLGLLMANRARGHHSVPEGYLKAWAGDDRQALGYRLVVPHECYPRWERRPIRSLTRYDDLYTSSYSGQDSDEHERWFNENIESPAAEPLARVRAGGHLCSADIQRLALYVLALDQRTPEAYVEFMERTQPALQQSLNAAMGRLESRLKASTRRSARRKPNTFAIESRSEPGPAFPMRIRTVSADEEGKVGLLAEVTLGREMWLWQQRLVVERFAAYVASLDWRILQPHDGHAWFTSDHPVVRLNYRTPDQFDFKGGWGVKNCEILIALSPQHLLYTKIGGCDVLPSKLSIEMAGAFQRFIALRAHRWIIGRAPSLRAEWWAPRTVDRALFEAEKATWSRWNQAQRDAETPAA
jgi:hypothetical protein